MLQHFPGDVQAQILRVDHAAHEAEAVGQQIGAVFHDHHAGGVQLQALLEVLGVEIIRCLGRDIEQGLIRDRALDIRVDDGQRVFEVEELLLIEIVVFLVGDVLLVLVPDGNHGVERLDLGVGLVLGLLVLLRALFHAALFDLHADGVADVVGVFAHELLQLPGLEEAGIFFVVGVGLELHDDVGADVRALTRGHSVAVRALGFPFPGLVGAVFLRDDGHLVRDHERRVEAHAELADDVGIGALVTLHLLAEFQTAGGGDDAQVVLQLLLAHADAVVADGQQAALLINGQFDLKLVPSQAHLVVRQAQVAQLVDSVGGVGDDLPQEYLLVGIDGIDHQVQQAFALRLECLFLHTCSDLLCSPPPFPARCVETRGFV